MGPSDPRASGPGCGVAAPPPQQGGGRGLGVWGTLETWLSHMCEQPVASLSCEGQWSRNPEGTNHTRYR